MLADVLMLVVALQALGGVEIKKKGHGKVGAPLAVFIWVIPVHGKICSSTQ